eukprot:scaffold24014_cov16-Tisochrysis_lutea.AAC.2
MEDTLKNPIFLSAGAEVQVLDVSTGCEHSRRKQGANSSCVKQPRLRSSTRSARSSRARYDGCWRRWSLSRPKRKLFMSGIPLPPTS